MFSTTKAATVKFVGWGATLSLLSLLTACGRDQLSLPVAQAATSPSQIAVEVATATESALPPTPEPQIDQARLAQSLSEFTETTEDLYRILPSKSCYAYMLRRPRAQRAEAVQARLLQADRMSAALDSEIFNVDLVGDHANVLSLEFPLRSTAVPGYAEKVNSVIVEYLSSQQIQDYLCDSGFSEVTFSAREPDNGPARLVWSARVTTDGLMKQSAHGKRERLTELAASN